MNDSRVAVLRESFLDISKDINQSLHQSDKETLHYNFLRLYRLLSRIENMIENSFQKAQPVQIRELFSLSRSIRQSLGAWTAEVASKTSQEGDYERSENEWLSSLSFYGKPDYYLQYGYSILRSKNLYVNKDIIDNMEFVNKFNVNEVKIALNRARLSVKSSISETGMNESAGYFLTWIDLMEKEINESPELVQALSLPEERVTLEECIAELNDLIGMGTVKRKIKEISDWVSFTQMRREAGLKTDEISLHMVFSGNPGTGKTTVARIVAKVLKALGVLQKGHLIEVGRSDLVAEYVGQTAVKTMGKIKEAEHGVLFIDEAYSLTRSGGNDFGIEAIDTLVKAMEDNRKNLVVILAGYPNEMDQFIGSNPGLYSRFKYHIDFPDYSVQELMKIHDILLKQKQYKITEQANHLVKSIITKQVEQNPKSHGNGRLVRNLIEDEILNKAAFAVEQKKNNLQVQNLDVIDETILKMVEMSAKTSEELNRMIHNKAMLQN